MWSWPSDQCEADRIIFVPRPSLDVEYQGEPSASYHSKNEANQLWSELGRGELASLMIGLPRSTPRRCISIPAPAENGIVDNGRAYQASQVLGLKCNAQG